MAAKGMAIYVYSGNERVFEYPGSCLIISIQFNKRYWTSIVDCHSTYMCSRYVNER